MPEPRLEHQTIKIRQLIEDFRAGRTVIPEFQRDYVWKPGRAPYLVDSLYRGYPVASLLLWQSSEATKARRLDPRPSRSGPVCWLIDGQQRVITLARTWSGDEGIDVVFHPEEDDFQLANAATKNDPNWFRVADLWDEESYRILRRNLDGSRRSDKREERFEKVRRILDYEVPLVRMVDHAFDDAVVAFTRINTLGMRLKKEDIESARVAAKHTGFIMEEVSPFLEELRRKGFTRLNVMHLFRACAFIARPDGRNRTPLHELERSEVMAAWKRTVRATEQAIAILQSELGLVNMEILWSGALLVPIIVLCANTNPRERDVPGMIAWLSLATLLHRYSGSSETSLDQDLRACRSPDPVGGLLSNLRELRPKLVADENDFGGSLNDKSALLAVYIACKHRGLRDFFMGGSVLLHSGIDKHHILPRGQFDESKRAAADNIANMVFIAGDVSRSIGQSGPEVYIKRIGEQVLISQCIPLDERLWRIENADDFWRARRALLSDSFNEFVRESVPQRRL